jgi:hypothetical protein
MRRIQLALALSSAVATLASASLGCETIHAPPDFGIDDVDGGREAGPSDAAIDARAFDGGSADATAPDTGGGASSITVTTDGSGFGTVTSMPVGIDCGATCTASFANGTTVILQPHVDAMNTFGGWTGCDSVTGGGSCVIMLASARTVVATFTHVDACAGGHGSIAGYDCVPPAPGGWTGPLAFWDDAGTTPHTCDASYTSMTYTGSSMLAVPPAVCSTCTCGAVTNGTCQAAVWGSTNACVSDSVGLLYPLTVGCANFGGPSYPYAHHEGDGVAGAHCGAPSPQTPTLPPTSWGRTGTACGLPAPASTTGCTSGDVCVAVPPTGVPGAYHLCISQAGDLACPSDYPTKFVTYTGTTEGRSCTACGCTLNSGSCAGTIHFYSDGGCGSEIASAGLTTALQCQALGGNFQSARVDWSGPTGASCNPQASSPTGTVTPATPTTFCCR